jgi:hypothetical protein
VLPFGNVRTPQEGRHALARAVAGPGCLVFLWVYSALHLGHERGLDLPFALAVSPVPLFSTFLLSLAAACGASIAIAVVARATCGRPAVRPRALLCSIAIFAAVMVLFP